VSCREIKSLAKHRRGPNTSPSPKVDVTSYIAPRMQGGGTLSNSLHSRSDNLRILGCSALGSETSRNETEMWVLALPHETETGQTRGCRRCASRTKAVRPCQSAAAPT
jgi:hypothetical protein